MPLPAAYNTTPGGVDLPPAVPPVTANELAYVTSTAEQIKAQKMRNELAAEEVQNQKEQQNILAKNWAEQGNPLATQGSPTAPAVAEAAGDYAKTPAQALERYTGEKPTEPDKKYQIQVPGRPTTEWLYEQVKAGAIHPAAAYQLDKETTAMKIKMADGYIEQAKSYAAIIKDDMTGAVESGDHEAVTRILKGAKDMFPDNPIIQRKADDALANIAKGVMPNASGKEPAGDDANVRKMYEAKIREKNPGMPMTEVRGRAAEMTEDAKAKRAEGRIDAGISAREDAAERKAAATADAFETAKEGFLSGTGLKRVESFILDPQVKTGIPARDIAQSKAFMAAVDEVSNNRNYDLPKLRAAHAADKKEEAKLAVTQGLSESFLGTIDNNIALLQTHLKDVAKRLNLDHSRLVNMPIQEFEQRVKGSSDVSIKQMLTSAISDETAKLQQGGAGSVAQVAQTASARMHKIYDDNMPVSELMKLMDWSSKEGGSRTKALSTTRENLQKKADQYLHPDGGGKKPPVSLEEYAKTVSATKGYEKATPAQIKQMYDKQFGVQ
jgi:hypothetical protein